MLNQGLFNIGPLWPVSHPTDFLPLLILYRNNNPVGSATYMHLRRIDLDQCPRICVNLLLADRITSLRKPRCITKVPFKCERFSSSFKRIDANSPSCVAVILSTTIPTCEKMLGILIPAGKFRCEYSKLKISRGLPMLFFRRFHLFTVLIAAIVGLAVRMARVADGEMLGNFVV